MSKSSSTPKTSQGEGNPTPVNFDAAWRQARILVQKFRANEAHYRSGAYQEAHLRNEFLNKLFVALGWDVLHDHEHDPYRQEVRIERPDRRAPGRADYAFSLAPAYQRVRFLMEAKRPQNEIATPDNCFQAIRYSWPLGLPIVILTDFQHIHVLDSRFRPNINSAVSRIVKTWSYTDLEDRESFSEIYWLLSREAVSQNSIDRFASDILPSSSVASRQYSLFPAETRDFDDDFLQRMDEWRGQLANIFKKARRSLTGAQLTEVVQRAIDRLIFIRFLEDKAIEQDPIIARFGAGNRTAWDDFIRASQRLDATYNGIVFKPHAILDDKNFAPNGAQFQDVCDDLTDEHSPYHFGSIPVEILGRIYERFLGKVVEIEGGKASVVEKAAVRRNGGVFYTPSYIVDYMVDEALGPLVKPCKTVESLLKVKLIDTACGSGSFLISSFTYLMASALKIGRAAAKPPKSHFQTRDGELHLSLALKRQLLTRCIYGVDIDPQAVEVAQLSLYLKLMEDETTFSASNQQIEMGATILPSLSRNIIEGNSLVTLDEDLFDTQQLTTSKSLNFPDTFPEVFRQGGFDLVIGNPPYIKEPTNRAAFDYVRTSPYYQGKMDLWYLFAARGLDWLRPKTGTLAIIATNNWVTNAGASKLRKKLSEDGKILQLIDFANFMVFRDASIQTMILLARRDQDGRSYRFDYRKIDARCPTLEDAQDILARRPSNRVGYLTPQVHRDAGGNSLSFSGESDSELLSKIQRAGQFRLDGSKELSQGIVPNPDVVTKNSIDAIPLARRRAKSIQVGDGVFVVPSTTFKRPSRDERAFLKPLYQPADVARYAVVGEPTHRIIYSVRNRHRNDVPPPRILEHLKQFSEIMAKRRETQNGRIETFHLHWPRNEAFFQRGEKILAVRKCDVPTFAYTEEEAYVMMAFNVIKTSRINMKYLTAILNSNVIKFWLKHKGKMQGNNFQIDSDPISKIPICLASSTDQNRIADLVDRRATRARAVAEAQTAAEEERALRLLEQTESAIQSNVAKLYGLDEADLRTIAPRQSLGARHS